MRQVLLLDERTRTVDRPGAVRQRAAGRDARAEDRQHPVDRATRRRSTAIDRDPAGEPLLGFANRVPGALRRLQRRGRDDHQAGRQGDPLPAVQHGQRRGRRQPGQPERRRSTSYLWERVLQRDSWLHIIGKLLHLETKTDVDPITGEASKKTTLLFPRFHQWELVTNLLDDREGRGPGAPLPGDALGRLGQDQLDLVDRARPRDPARRGQREGLRLRHRRHRPHRARRPAADRRSSRSRASTAPSRRSTSTRSATPATGSKSGLLAARAARREAHRHRDDADLPVRARGDPGEQGPGGQEVRDHRRRGALLADRRTSQKLRAVLTAEELSRPRGRRRDRHRGAPGRRDGGARRVAEPVLLRVHRDPEGEDAGAVRHARTADGVPRPFHVYTMQQAIEEGYILDVLRTTRPTTPPSRSPRRSKQRTSTR